MFGVYIHVPFCQSRCGYCDFNTYVPGELGAFSPATYLDALERELQLMVQSYDIGPAHTVFIGGGTPSVLGAKGLSRILDAIRSTCGIARGAEITTESNPESTSPEFFDSLLKAGFTRLSLGMQSASPRVLKVLERQHTPGRAFEAVREAQRAGINHINLDMIYGTPTERDSDIRATLEQILALDIDHISAYSLIVEDGTRMARKIRNGHIPAPDEDIYADRFEMIDRALQAAGFDWYEVSNWAKKGGQCHHNLGYWRNHDWWGAGPGAHSHLDGTRFYNVKHPARYAQMINAGQLPIAEREVLSTQERHEEQVMLGLRLKEGLGKEHFNELEVQVIQRFAERGLLTVGQRVAVSDRGRLLADGMIADILVAGER
ncbi:radical SAM family heme chaperone HemW [Corynebacterium sp. ES2794-CONJ1]|uniref:radical SAM family heme chaperone HemW n=1 Tax=unclassified Corynebacterium TaxID=2624378 RepID=UPI00216A0812|nr:MULTISPECIES: radical SAM family heme chaperone HemW [unclassified Corynebacterium]MCS4490574.1 radical SAM family heme chaperone HemW [Corynebacterium sp. ES2775-CONJ]MCS4492353.1 radical SAM family heme chaperone HemW [Corynebacterium sp. ES2715-CONJ3]MCS4532455.1 radical SAM family heme chaperone HemW [Corynebacterium sp. ES2730-CONJ]MCU9519850.1 radical SAM family heme chaperone HemW [Corynebacterium sp. ES2794-CONJ1]